MKYLPTSWEEGKAKGNHALRKAQWKILRPALQQLHPLSEKLGGCRGAPGHHVGEPRLRGS